MFDQLAAAREVLEELASTRVAERLDAADAHRALHELATIRRVVDALVMTTGLRVGAEPFAHAMHVNQREARSTLETAAAVEQLAATGDAMREGRLSTREAKMIADTASVNPAAEENLLAAAGLGRVALRDACIAARAQVEDNAARSRRQRSLRTLRTWTDADGMYAGFFRMTPEVGGRFKAALDKETQRAFRARRSGEEHVPLDALSVDALATLILNGNGAAVEARVHIVVDHGVLKRGDAIEGERCEIPGVGPVNVEWVRELLGSAFLTAVIRKGTDITTVAHLGRHVPAEVVTALVVRGRECEIEGCLNRGYLEKDHIDEYARGGVTSYENLEWICGPDHLKKSNGWIVGPRDPVTGKRTLRPPPARVA